jgi:glyoxylase-like metal-dependent hydrolase (beta-lactamase superfamily II)
MEGRRKSDLTGLRYHRMKKQHPAFFFCLVVFLVVVLCGRTQAEMKMTKISDRVAVFENFGVNVVALAGSKGIVIIDTHRSPAFMAETKLTIERVFKRNDFLYVVNTHGDYDHCGGNQLFPDSMIIGHENCPQWIRQKPPNSILSVAILKYYAAEANRKADTSIAGREEAAEWRKLAEDIETHYVATPPSKTFRDSLTLDLGDLTLQLFYCGNAHTNNDIFIYVPEEQIVLTGDMFTSKSSFGFAVNNMIDVPRILSSMDRILQRPEGIKYVVPGHGDYFAGKEFPALRDLLKEKFRKFEGKQSAARLLETSIRDSGLECALNNYHNMTMLKDGRYYFSEDEFSNLGGRFLGEGKIQEAKAVFTLSVEKFPQSALAHGNLASACLKTGEIELAIKQYKKSLRLFPGDNITKEILRTLTRKR